MKPQPILRPYQRKDAKALEAIIMDTWQYRQFCDEKTARKLARAYLFSCLTNQTFTRVAVLNDIPSGIIMAKNKQISNFSVKLQLKKLCSILSLLLSHQGRKVCNIFNDVSAIDQALYLSCKQKFDGEIAFFAVNEHDRGKGIGNLLFQSCLTYMKAEHIQHFFLYTDTSCHYQFYEHQGMQCRAQKKHPFLIQQQPSEMTFFLFSKQLS